VTPRTREARVLEVTSYPPPRAGWGIRVEFLKKRLESEGHACVVLNIGTSRAIPSDQYETVISGGDFVRKVWRYSRQGFIVHAHANGDALKGIGLALIAEALNLLSGQRCFLTFHAGAIQRYFPRTRSRWLFPVFWLLFTIPRRIICNSEAVKVTNWRSGNFCMPTVGQSGAQWLSQAYTNRKLDVEAALGSQCIGEKPFSRFLARTGGRRV